jgi:pimeloyl-ACP methyl ester carboxylesterase
MPIATANGIDICYEELGSPDDPCLLLVTGFKGQLTAFRPDLCALFVEQGLRVVRFDNRDSGLSSKTPADVLSLEAPPYTVADMALDVVGLLDHLGIEGAHVVGVSMGGIIAQSLAIDHPNRVLTMASIMSTTGDPTVGGATPEAEAAALAPVPEDRTAAIQHHVDVHKLVSGPHFDEAQTREDATVAFDRSNYPQGGMYQVIAVMADGDRTERLAGVSCPTVVIHGAVDPLVNVSGGEATAKAIPGAELIVLPDMGHELPPGLFPQIVDAVVRNIRRASAAG